jgi:hypothetical protein
VELFGLFLTFGDEPKRAEKKRTSFRAADTVSWRPPKATDISNKLAAPSAIEQITKCAEEPLFDVDIL